MGDHEGGPVSSHLDESSLDQRLSGNVDTGRGVIQHQYGRIQQYGPRYGEALALSARQRHAPLAHHRVVAVGQALDEVVQLRRFGCANDIVTGRICRTLGDVVIDRGGEHKDVLEHDTHVPAE